MAWAEGDVSADEKGLLEKLVAKYFTSGDGSGANQEAARQLAAWTVDCIIDTWQACFQVQTLNVMLLAVGLTCNLSRPVNMN